ncbi:hypothetical protein JZ751_012265 [Albula glossodonta]|nr:hypothetical protein JZ751_012265 [Albula glossodonta]
MPPEWFEKQKFLAGPGTVWSVGVTVFNIVCDSFPFNVFTSRKMRHVEFPEELRLSPEFQDFIRCCFTFRPEDRPTLEQLQHHPWLHQTC